MAYTTINKPSLYFNTVLYTGDGTTNRSITGVGFKPDWTWIKSRSNTYYHELYDAVRGFASTTNGRVLYSNTTGVEGTPNTFNSFNTDGFTVSNQSGEVGTNGNGATFVAWNWLGANTTASNTQGTITSTVSTNTTSGFSIVSYTGNGTAGATVGHGLGVKPRIVIIKNRDSATNWSVYSQALVDKTGNNSSTLVLNNTAADGLDGSYFNSTQPTSSVFSIGSNSGVSGSGNSLIAYCFAEVKGFSKFGSYTGNGSTDGTFVYTGFKPAMIITKANAVADWFIRDNKQDPENVMNEYLSPNTTATSGNLDSFDFVSNGFKIRNSNNAWNGSGTTYIYMAFAQNPFVSSTSIPTTAR
jgi:hypothetical protein